MSIQNSFVRSIEICFEVNLETILLYLKYYYYYFLEFKKESENKKLLSKCLFLFYFLYDTEKSS